MKYTPVKLEKSHVQRKSKLDLHYMLSELLLIQIIKLKIGSFYIKSGFLASYALSLNRTITRSFAEINASSTGHSHDT